MSRLMWMGIGAVGGIYVYRRSQRAWDRARERGLTGNATAVATTAAQWYGQIREAQESGRERYRGAVPPVAMGAADAPPRTSSQRHGGRRTPALRYRAVATAHRAAVRTT